MLYELEPQGYRYLLNILYTVVTSIPSLYSYILKWLNENSTMSAIFVSITILISILIAKWLWGHGRLLTIKTYQHLFFKSNDPLVFKGNNRCIMITGRFGVGKTYYYRHKLKCRIRCEELCRFPIEISCFSANKAELINQIIMAQWVYRVFSINGFLIELLRNNWRMFCPKNTVIVFDDFERLHANNESFLDIIGIIDYLKQKGNKIIILANLDEVNNDIVNRYFERIVDVFYTNDHFKSPLVNILKSNRIDLDALMNKFQVDNDYREILIKICKNLINSIEELRNKGYANNLRVILNIFPNLIKGIVKSLKNYRTLIDKEIIGNYYSHDFERWYKLRYLYWHDRMFFKKIFDGKNWHEVRNSDNEDKEKIENKLRKYGLTSEVFTNRELNKRICDNDHKYITNDYYIHSITPSDLTKHLFIDLLPLRHNDPTLKAQLYNFLNYNEHNDYSPGHIKPILDYKNKVIISSPNVLKTLEYKKEIFGSDIVKNIKKGELNWLYNLIARVAGGDASSDFRNCAGVALLMMIDDKNKLGLDKFLDDMLKTNDFVNLFDKNNYPRYVCKYIANPDNLSESRHYITKNKDGTGYLLIVHSGGHKEEYSIDLVSGNLLEHDAEVYWFDHNQWYLDSSNVDIMYAGCLWLMEPEKTTINSLYNDIKEYLYKKWKHYLKIVYEKQFDDPNYALPQLPLFCMDRVQKLLIN